MEAVKTLVTPIDAQQPKTDSGKVSGVVNPKQPKGSVPLYIGLPEALQLIKKLADAEPIISGSRLAIAMGNSISSSSFLRKATALRAFSLIESGDAKDTFTLTELGRTIIAPRTPQAEAVAVRDCLVRVEPFRKIFDHHKGKLLPADEFLRNLIEQDCKIPKNFSEKWVTDFKAAATCARLLHDRGNGRIQLAEDPMFDATEPLPDDLPSLPTEESNKRSDDGQPPSTGRNSYRNNTERIEIPTACGHTAKIEVSGPRWAIFFIPDRLSGGDAKKLKKALEGMQYIIDSMLVEDGA